MGEYKNIAVSGAKLLGCRISEDAFCEEDLGADVYT